MRGAPYLHQNVRGVINVAGADAVKVLRWIRLTGGMPSLTGKDPTAHTGWTAEFFIPWSAVSMPATGPVRKMGLYMSRKVAYVDQRWGWPALPETVPKFMSALQPLEMEHIAPRQQYNIYPFLSVTRDGIDDETLYKPGADLVWRPSSTFQLTATVNPDFGNVESDEVVVNLKATETFFPEKRLFFLEGQEIPVLYNPALPRARVQWEYLRVVPFTPDLAAQRTRVLRQAVVIGYAPVAVFLPLALVATLLAPPPRAPPAHAPPTGRRRGSSTAYEPPPWPSPLTSKVESSSTSVSSV